MREARQKHTDSGSSDMKTAIANKQPVITKNIFSEFELRKLRLLYKASIASGEDVLGRSKKPPLQAVFVQKTIPLSFSYSAIKIKKTQTHCIKYTERLFCQN